MIALSDTDQGMQTFERSVTVLESSSKLHGWLTILQLRPTLTFHSFYLAVDAL